MKVKFLEIKYALPGIMSHLPFTNMISVEELKQGFQFMKDSYLIWGLKDMADIYTQTDLIMKVSGKMVWSMDKEYLRIKMEKNTLVNLLMARRKDLE